MGPVKNVEVDYDTSGRSNENATVTFTKTSDAIAAVQRFNGTELVGKKLVLSILPNEEKKPEKFLIKRKRSLQRKYRFTKLY